MLKVLSLLTLIPVSCVAKVPPSDEIKIPPPEARIVSVAGEDMVVLGDQGTGTSQQMAVASALERFCQMESCDFGLMVGDNFYPAGVESVKDPKWQNYLERPYRNLHFTFYPALGNHDYMGNWKAQVAYRSARWNMPYRYYKLKTAYADIICVDSEYLDTTQLAWVEKELKASKAPWQVVYTHRPIYSSGEHGDTSALKKLLLPILERNGVDLVLAGHDHDMELQVRAGMIHVVSGSGGKRRSLKNGAYTLFGQNAAGFLHVDFEPTMMRLRFIGEGARVLYTKVAGAAALMEDQ